MTPDTQHQLIHLLLSMVYWIGIPIAITLVVKFGQWHRRWGWAFLVGLSSYALLIFPCLTIFNPVWYAMVVQDPMMTLYTLISIIAVMMILIVSVKASFKRKGHISNAKF